MGPHFEFWLLSRFLPPAVREFALAPVASGLLNEGLDLNFYKAALGQRLL